jgi:hypothetical protein
VSVVHYQVGMYALGWSLVQRSAMECGMSDCDHETSTVRRSRPTRAVEPLETEN